MVVVGAEPADLEVEIAVELEAGQLEQGVGLHVAGQQGLHHAVGAAQGGQGLLAPGRAGPAPRITAALAASAVTRASLNAGRCEAPSAISWAARNSSAISGRSARHGQRLGGDLVGPGPGRPGTPR